MAAQPGIVSASYDDTATFGGRLAALAALVALMGLTLLQIYRVAPGDDAQVRAESFAYTQDQAYQQLVIGRELAQGAQAGPQHYRGATPLAGSASPGWSVTMAVLLGLPALSPDRGRSLDEIALVPMVVNLVAAALLIGLVGHLVGREIRSAFWMFLFLAAVGVFIPLPLLVLTGMEHLGHMVFIVLAVAVALNSLGREMAPVLRVLLAAILIAIAVSLRYESLGVLVGLVLWAWIQRRPGSGLLWLLSGVAVVVAVGVYLTAHGGFFVPNPLLVHASALLVGSWQEWPASVLQHALDNLQRVTLPWMLLAMGLVLLASWRGRTHSPDPVERGHTGWLFVFVFAAAVHLLLGPVAADLRHTAYLVPLAAVAIGRAVGAAYNRDRLLQPVPAPAGVGPGERAAVITPGARPWYRGNAMVATVCTFPLVLMAAPAIRGFLDAPSVVRESFARQRVTASFARTYYPQGPVAINQTGVMAYETRLPLVDLSGLTDRELAAARWQGRYDSELLAGRVSETQAQVALLMGDTRDMPVPRSWRLIGGWHRAGADRDSASAVRVYSVRPEMDSSVRIALRLFSERTWDDIEFWFVQDEAALPGADPVAI